MLLDGRDTVAEATKATFLWPLLLCFSPHTHTSVDSPRIPAPQHSLLGHGSSSVMMSLEGL